MHEIDSADSQSLLRRQVDVLHRVNKFTSTLTDLKQLLKAIMEESQKVTDAEASSLALLDEKTDELFFEIALGEKGAATKELRIKKGEGIIGQVALSGKSQKIDDVYADTNFASRVDDKTGFKTKSILAVPMEWRGRLIGVLEVLNKQNSGGVFTDEDQEILEMLAHQAAIAIENARLIQENIDKERLASLGQGIAGAAHCIKNIITLVTLSSDGIDFGLKKESLEIVNDSWPIVRKGCDQITEMVMDMLAYSKQRTPEYSSTDLNALFSDIIEMVSQRLTEKNISVTQDLDPEIGSILIGKQEIRRCIMNLFSNAMDALRKDGRIILTSKLLKEQETVKIEFSDNGPGIPGENLEKIFEAFFSSKGSQGTGLGLSMTKKIINEHGGDITVTSVLDKGTAFLITLPARRS